MSDATERGLRPAGGFDLRVVVWVLLGALAAGAACTHASKALAVAAAAAALVGAACIAVLHGLVNWYRPVRFVSEFQRDLRYGRIMDLAFVLLGVAAIWLGLASHGALAQSDNTACWFLWTLGLAAAGCLIVLLSHFVTDSSDPRPEEVAESPMGRAHNYLSVAAFAVLVICMFSGSMLRGPGGSLLRAWELGLGLAGAACLLVQGIVSVCCHDERLLRARGIVERALILTILAWMAARVWMLLAG